MMKRGFALTYLVGTRRDLDGLAGGLGIASLLLDRFVTGFATFSESSIVGSFVPLITLTVPCSEINYCRLLRKESPQQCYGLTKSGGYREDQEDELEEEVLR